ncbi:MAG TPA: hypothetical protein VGN13_12340 [Solirubrobacteraceae bacterium]|jgi:hypothetical protein
MTTAELIEQVTELAAADVEALKTTVAGGTPITLEQGEGLFDTVCALDVLHEVQTKYGGTS